MPDLRAFIRRCCTTSAEYRAIIFVPIALGQLFSCTCPGDHSGNAKNAMEGRQLNERWRDAVRTVQGVRSKYKRLVKAMAADIESGALASGARLPPQRDVATELEISVQTVTNAY